jgi:hypothetical protein
MASAYILIDPSLQAQHKQSVTLSDGRALDYAEFGSPNEDATTVLAFHGWPRPRLGSAVFHSAASELNVCIIGIGRPGLVLSSPQTKRKLLDWHAEASACGAYTSSHLEELCSGHPYHNSRACHRYVGRLEITISTESR